VALLAVLLAAAIGAIAMLKRPAPPAGSAAAYAAEVEAWQKWRHKRLTADDGWLVVSALIWLKEGDNPFGNDSSNAVVLPSHSVPPRAGLLKLEGGKVFIELQPLVKAKLRSGTEEKNLSGRTELRPDVPGPPDLVVMDEVHFFVLDRDGKMAIRVRDLRNPARQAFKGLEYFPVQEAYRVQARLQPHAEKTVVKVPTVLGNTTEMVSPGRLHFQLRGQELALDPVIEPDDPDRRLFVIFKDTTSGKQTYGAGRYIYADQSPDGKIMMDFNKAYSPPCALTSFATCPLPPPQNRLAVAIEAGEKFSGKH
jgi:uncharacterized protein (DUF1684 family)